VNGGGGVWLRPLALAASLILAWLPAGASTNTYYEGACKYIDAGGVLKFDGVCFITFGVQNSYYVDSDEQPGGYNAGAAYFDLLFPNGARVSVIELTWYQNGDPVDADLDPRDFLQALVNRKPAAIVARPFEQNQRGPSTTVAITVENEVFIFDACGEVCGEAQYDVDGQSLWELGEDGWLAIRGE